MARPTRIFGRSRSGRFRPASSTSCDSAIKRLKYFYDLDDLTSFMLESLKLAARAANISYNGYDYKSLNREDKALLGRFAVEIASETHPNAAIIGYKLLLPTYLVNDDHPPLKENDCSDAVHLSDVDVEIFVIIRGSYLFDEVQLRLSKEASMKAACHDWIGSNFRFLFSTPIDEDILPDHIARVHTGFLFRHRRLFPVIHRHIKETLDKLKSYNLNIKTVRFALCGHSQGAALATLTAIALN